MISFVCRMCSRLALLWLWEMWKIKRAWWNCVMTFSMGNNLDNNKPLTHWGRATHICVSKLATIGSDYGLSPWRRQAIIRTKCSNIVNWTLGNKFQWNLNRNSSIFIQQNGFENVVWKMAAICLGLNVLILGVPADKRRNDNAIITPCVRYGHMPLLKAILYFGFFNKTI